ncbi:MAG TPA: alpha/beta fold hydrolase, partial [Halobacteriales archaeon]|nr:alpha/beta fold hydrolase [Halobacteriales archaeon]
MVALDGTDLTAPDGTRIRRWERVPAGATDSVLFVHGATYGGRSAFDPEGFSWLEAVAEDDRAAYAVDVRGYGDSERPPELDAPADENEPVVRASTAAMDVAAAVAELRDAYRSVHLVGYSWGTIIAGLGLAEGRFDVDSLVQYAPVHRPPETHR